MTLAAMAGASTLVGCSDFLEAENKSAGGQTADDYFSTAEGLEYYRIYAYSLFKPLVNGTYIDMFDDGTDIYWPSRNEGLNFFLLNQTTGEDATVKSFYSACYSLINACNGLIQYGGTTYESEAKFLRTYAYYLLTQQIGSVPYVTTYINNASRDYPRTPLAEVYAGMLQDLKDVVADEAIPATSKHDGTVNKQAANALAARVALAAGWDLNDNAYFGKAAEYAEAALSGVDLYSTFAQKWSADNDETNQEEFFSLEYDRTSWSAVGSVDGGGHSLQNQYGSYYDDPAKRGTKKCSSQRVCSKKTLYLFEASDERYATTFAITHLNWDGSNWPTSGYYAKYNAANPDQLPIAYYYAPAYTSEDDFNAFLEANKSRFVKGNNLVTPYAYLLGNPVKKVDFNADGSVKSTTSYNYGDGDGILSQVNALDCVAKWDDPQTTQLNATTLDYRDIVLLHATETMLTAAEAYLKSGNESKALEYVNKVRDRAKASHLASFDAYKPDYVANDSYEINLEPLDVILDERARELYAEPGRWMDLRRTKKLESYANTFLYNANDNLSQVIAHEQIKTLRPIPVDEINSNNAISAEDQNPDYKTN